MSRREKLEQMLLTEPDDTFLNFGLAMELAKEGRVADAITRFDRVLTLDPSYTTAFLQKATTLISSGRPDEAKRVLIDGMSSARFHGDTHAAEEMQSLLDRLA